MRNWAQSPFALSVFSWLAIRYIRLVISTNKIIFEPEDAVAQVRPHQPVIAGVWHGQHVLVAALPIGLYAAAMVSRNLDGEITARIIESFGHTTVRASGGREQKTTLQKGGIAGFLEMLNVLRSGGNVIQTADIPKGTPRKAGMGIIRLAQKSGAPVLPLASASSRRYIFRRSWDKATIPLPFGTTSVCIGDLIHVPQDANERALNDARDLLDREMRRITDKAYALTGNPE